MARKKYTQEFKAEAVRLSEQGDKTIGQQAADFGDKRKGQLHKWRREIRERGAEAFPGKGRARDEEMAEWKRRALRAEIERDILKKTVRILCAEYEVRREMLYGFMERHEAAYPVAVMCGVLEVGASGYYAWRGRPASERAQADEGLKARIAEVWVASRKTYGSPRMTEALKAQGEALRRESGGAADDR